MSVSPSPSFATPPPPPPPARPAVRGAHPRWVAVVVLAAALALLAAGSSRKTKIYETGTDDFGIQAFTRVTERQMVVDSTFGGIALERGRLVSTYDRTAPAGKRACPT